MNEDIFVLIEYQYNQMHSLHTNKAKKLAYMIIKYTMETFVPFFFFLFTSRVGYDLLYTLHSLATFTESILYYIASEQMERVQI